MAPYTFHSRAGSHVVVTNGNQTAFRNHPAQEFNDGVVLSGKPLKDDMVFAVRIDKKVNSWSGSIEIGVTSSDPYSLNFPTSATGFRSGTWVMSGSSVLKDGHTVIEEYGKDLDQLEEGDNVGVMRTSSGALHFYVNGEDQGEAAQNIPEQVYAVIDLYGKCCQVSVLTENNCQNVSLEDGEIEEEVAVGVAAEAQSNERLCFHARCGSLIRFGTGRLMAERRRPLDEFNNGVILSNRPLQDGELFEIQLDRLVDKWSGSIEIGVTTHNPSNMEFPATMTNMRNGYIILNGRSILAHGKEILREYSVYNLDELKEGDRIGIMRRPNGNLHFYINEMDQGLAAARCPAPVWAVVDLYGMAVRVSITERTLNGAPPADASPEMPLLPMDGNVVAEEEEDLLEPLTFHPRCGSHAIVINNGRTAYRPNAVEEFNNAVVLTTRMLNPGEMFEVQLDKVIDKWAGSIEIGVTTHTPGSLDFPSTMTNIRSGTWMMTGNGVMHNGTTVIDEYGQNLDRLKAGDRVAGLLKQDRTLHFYVNGVDQGLAAQGVPPNVYGVIDLYGQASQATVVDHSSSIGDHERGATRGRDLRFYHLHGRNAIISAGGKTASRPNARGEFNDAIVITSRALMDDELFEVTIDRMVDRWSGSIEAGVTLIGPEDLPFPSTMTDIDYDTWMLSGSAVMQDGCTIRNGYRLDLDAITASSRVGMMRCTDGTLHYYLNGQDQGVACLDVPSGVYAVIDLYGQCAQVTISDGRQRRPREENQVLLSELDSSGASIKEDVLHRFSQCCGKNVAMKNNLQRACRLWNFNHGLVFSMDPLKSDEVFEVKVEKVNKQWSGSLKVGLTAMAISDSTPVSTLPPSATDLSPKLTWLVSGGDVYHGGSKIRATYSPSLDRLQVGSRVGVQRSADASMHIYINGEDIGVAATNLPKNVFAVVDVYGCVDQIAVTSSVFGDYLCMSQPPSMHSLDSINVLQIKDEEADVEEPPASCHFHGCHGKNVELSRGHLVARRTSSYNQGMVLSNKPLQRGKLFQVRIDSLNTDWSSSLSVGVVAFDPEKCPLPAVAVNLKKAAWVIKDDVLFHNAVKTKTLSTHLGDLGVGQTVGVLVDDKGGLHLYTDGVDQGVVAGDLPRTCYAVVDLYGSCQQVSVVTDDKDRENDDDEEKDRDKEKFLVKDIKKPLAVIETQPKHCEYFNLCGRFRTIFGLPEGYMNATFSRCFCESCHKHRGDPAVYRQGEPPREYVVPVGWCRFGIRLSQRAETQGIPDKWHVGYVTTDVANARRALDTGDLLNMAGEEPGGRLRPCPQLGVNDEKNKPDQVSDTRPICLTPNVQHLKLSSLPKQEYRDSKTRKSYSARAVFQVYVKPGSYKVEPQSGSSTEAQDRKRKRNVEWLTKERGATKICGLLVRLD